MLNWHLSQDCFSDVEMRRIWSETATLSAWIKVEQTLARVQSQAGLIPQNAAKAIETFSVADLDQDQMRDAMTKVGRPIVDLVSQMRAHIGPDLAPFAHFNCTTQDILDTSLAMQMKLSLTTLTSAISQLIAQLDHHIHEHQHTRLIGRTNGQHAVPMSLTTKLHVWRAELLRREQALQDAASRGLNVQIGGPLGDLSKYDGDSGQTVKTGVAQALGLGTVAPHWQNARDGVADIVTALGALCATLCKIAHNINLLSSSDIAEMSECPATGKGVSSSMHHKRNQRASEFTEAVARLGRQRSEQIGELTLHQHERSGGVWIAEWVVVPEIFLLTSGALFWSEKMLSDLRIDAEQMALNL